MFVLVIQQGMGEFDQRAIATGDDKAALQAQGEKLAAEINAQQTGESFGYSYAVLEVGAT